MTKRRDRGSRAEAEAGCRDHFVDADLYDYEYRHRRADLNFYRQLARNRMELAAGPILDLACGSGRLLLPLVRDGHQVIGIDRAPEMLAAAARRIRRLSASRRARCTLVRADLRAFATLGPATLAISAFHSVQHLYTDEDFLRFLACARTSLRKGGWLTFDVLPPDPAWLGRDPERRWGRTTFRHPSTKQRFVYTSNQVYDPGARLLHLRLHYQPVDDEGRPHGEERTVRLCHRQFAPDEIRRLLGLANFRIVEVFGGFDGRPLAGAAESDDEHVYVAVAV